MVDGIKSHDAILKKIDTEFTLASKFGNFPALTFLHISFNFRELFKGSDEFLTNIKFPRTLQELVFKVFIPDFDVLV